VRPGGHLCWVKLRPNGPNRFSVHTADFEVFFEYPLSDKTYNPAIGNPEVHMGLPMDEVMERWPDSGRKFVRSPLFGEGRHTVDYEIFIKSQLAPREFTSIPWQLEIW